MKFSDILEARVPGLDYENKPKTKKEPNIIDRIILRLKGSDSAIMTRLANRYMRIKKLTELLAAHTTKLNTEATEQMQKLFDAEDKVYTRVVETVSAVFTLSKEAEEEKLTPGQEHENRTKTDWQNVAIEIGKLLDKDLIPAYEALVQAATVTAAAPRIDPNAAEIKKKPGLRITPKEVKESEQVLLEDDKITQLVNKLVNTINAWAPKFDQKLAAIKAQM